MKKFFAAVFAFAALTALAAPAFAQEKKNPLRIELEEKQKAAAQTEKEYEAAMKKTQDKQGQAVAVDPWANMRQVNGSQPKH